MVPEETTTRDLSLYGPQIQLVSAQSRLILSEVEQSPPMDIVGSGEPSA